MNKRNSALPRSLRHRDSWFCKIVGRISPLSLAIIVAIYVISSGYLEGEPQAILYISTFPTAFFYLEWCVISRPYYWKGFDDVVAGFRMTSPNTQITKVLEETLSAIVQTKKTGNIPSGGCLRLSLAERCNVFVETQLIKLIIVFVIFAIFSHWFISQASFL